MKAWLYNKNHSQKIKLFPQEELEPKKSSPEPQSGTEELNIDGYGATFRKGYFVLPLYFKVRKIQIGKLWKTQFVTMHREEVLNFEEYKQSLIKHSQSNSVADFLEKVGNETLIE